MLWLCSLGGLPVSAGAQDITETPSGEATATSAPSATPPAEPSQTPTPSIEPSFSAVPATRQRPSATPVKAIHVRGEHVPGEVLVRFDDRAATKAINGCLHAADATIKSEIEDLSVLVLSVPEGTVGRAIASLRACQPVRLAEPNYLAHIADVIPSDTGWGAQYGLINIRAPQGWEYTTGSPAVTIAVIDTGVSLGHPDLSAKIVAGYDFVNGDAVAQDDHGHGTHVAGIAAAITNNGAGMAGVSWGAHIMPVKVLNAAGDGTFANVAAGITWAADQGAQVINLSLGGTSGSDVLQSAVDYAYDKGVVIVAAAGNSGLNFVLYPARYPHVIAVAATDPSNTHAAFSNYGPEVDLAAPGVSIYSTVPGGYGYLSGTSMSTPFVSGLAAILRGIPGIGSADAIAWDMESTALDLGPGGRDRLYGFGLIQMDGALRKAMGPRATASPTARPDALSEGFINNPAYLPGTASPTLTLTIAASPAFTLTPALTSTVQLPPPTLGSGSGEMSAAVGGPALSESLLSRLGTDWPLGCSGGLLIVLGSWLIWTLSHRASRRKPRQYFRTK